MKPRLTISSLHYAVLEQIKDKHLVRWPGGYWTYEGCSESKESSDNFHANVGHVPAWYVGTNTVRAMERRGLLKRANKHEAEWSDERIAVIPFDAR